MISKELLVKTWHCYTEIEKAEKMLKDLANSVNEHKENTEPTLYNAFGEKEGLSLGIPCGSSSYILYGVSIELGIKCIKAHIKNNKKKILEFEKLVKEELSK